VRDCYLEKIGSNIPSSVHITKLKNY